MKYLFTLFIYFFALLLPVPAYSFTLDRSVSKSRTFCGKTMVVTPVEESQRRGACEPFAQGVGRIKTRKEQGKSYGSGTLIAPSVVITSAHVVTACVDKPQNCKFVVDNPSFTSQFKRVFVLPKYTAITKTLAALDAFLADKNIGTSDRLFNEEIRGTQNMLKLEYDIAIVELEHRATFHNLPLSNLNINDDLKLRETSSAIAVAVNQIIDNKTTLEINSDAVRHIAVVTLRKVLQQDGLLSAQFSLPADYVDSCEVDKHKKRTSKLVRFSFDQTKDPFLMGTMQAGDSGGPLMAKIKGQLEIIGIATATHIRYCSVDKTLKPGDTYKNHWTPVYPHLAWIQNTLSTIGGDKN